MWFVIYFSLSFTEEPSFNNWIWINKDSCSRMGGFLIVWAFVNYDRGLHLFCFLKEKSEERKCERNEAPNASTYGKFCVRAIHVQASFVLPSMFFCAGSLSTDNSVFLLLYNREIALSVSVSICFFFFFLSWMTIHAIFEFHVSGGLDELSFAFVIIIIIIFHVIGWIWNYNVFLVTEGAFESSWYMCIIVYYPFVYLIHLCLLCPHFHWIWGKYLCLFRGLTKMRGDAILFRFWRG